MMLKKHHPGRVQVQYRVRGSGTHTSSLTRLFSQTHVQPKPIIHILNILKLAWFDLPCFFLPFLISEKGSNQEVTRHLLGDMTGCDSG